ncbi:auxin transport protein BIG [Impatiens glandulifera]|uniref:auxin transport protein BIG n=1 Tax=Impatiens glandulifera TaxID=253017 RepID=UPI001FB166D5|nr:auxin transport protein BIG [Impatiens glandulifera]XP_047314775.1 auxin transport protein BIG [Impatiens glandulifera]
MATDIAKLIELVFDEKSSGDISQLIGSDSSVRLGLERFFCILKFGVEVNGDGKLGLESWEQSQAGAVAFLACAVAYSTRSLSVENAEPIVFAVVEKALEFAICYLENSVSRIDEYSVQDNLIKLLEIALTDGTQRDILQNLFGNKLIYLLPASSVENDTIDLEVHTKCLYQGCNCSNDDHSVDRLLSTLASECMQLDKQNTGTSYLPDSGELSSLFQHWAVAHLQCFHRLILLCKELLHLPDITDEKIFCTNLCKQLSFCLRIIKLLRILGKDVPHVEYSDQLLQSVAYFADCLTRLFGQRFDFGSYNVAAENNVESLVLSLLEEFLLLVQANFSSTIFQNVRACIVASMMEHMDASAWVYDKVATSQKPPLAFFPRVVICILKQVGDIKQQADQSLDWEAFDIKYVSGADAQRSSPFCHVRSDKVFLLKKYNVEQLLNLIFPISNEWLENLMHAVHFLHSEGVSLKKLERSCSSVAKAALSMEAENTICHEEEALFGDLFSESGRSVGSTDVCDQPAITSSPIPNSNLPIQAGIELLSFLKHCVFSPDWLSSLYSSGCTKLKGSNIDILLSILTCQGCCSEESITSYEKKKIGVHQLCFELLHHLIIRRVLSGSLEEFLVEKVLNIENGVFAYNEQTLTLLAHILICRAGLPGSQLRSEIFRIYVGFIDQKIKSMSLSCPTLEELLGMLPSIYHIEILLMAFHLSSEVEKIALANLIYSSLKEIDGPPAGLKSMQVSSWALMVSRLVLVLRHMLFYPGSCPPLLLRELRTKLRETPFVGARACDSTNGQSSSWLSTIVQNLMGKRVRDSPFSDILLNQLIDIVPLPALSCRDETDVDRLNLRWADLCTTLSHILSFWRGKIALTVDDLIIERYMFVLCFDIPNMASTQEDLRCFWSGVQSLDTSNMEHLFCFSHSLLEHSGVLTEISDLSGMVHSMLQGLHADISEDTRDLGWDFLRDSAWISLATLLLNAGIHGKCSKQAITCMDPLWLENTSGNINISTLSETLGSRILDCKQVPVILQTLSSLLDKYLKVYEEAFLSALNGGHSNPEKFSPLLLLKFSEFDNNEILVKAAQNARELEGLPDYLLSIDCTVDKLSIGNHSKIFWESVLHGFPSHIQTTSGIFVTCILCIRGITTVLDGLLKITDVLGVSCMETNACVQILDSAMTIKSDKIFGCLHEKCKSIFLSLSKGIEGTDWQCLFVLKRMEHILLEINAKEVDDNSIYELVVNKTIDLVDSMRTDPSRAVILRFFLSVEDVSEQVKALYGSQRGDLLVLIDLLDKCSSESVNMKVLKFFIDLSGETCPGIVQKVQERFLCMDSSVLSKWLERRLGLIAEVSGGATCSRECSASLRELTMTFVACLLSSSSDQSKALHGHLFEAALLLLDNTFILSETGSAKSYFNFLVQLSTDESSIRSLLQRSLMLMEKFSGDEQLLQGLKFLFGFLITVLNDCGSNRSIVESSSGKSLYSNADMAPVSSRSFSSRKNSEAFVLTPSQEGGTSAIDCDATSLDEDEEDDETSDGEAASIDKEDDEDPNSERVLASKVCTFTSSGSNFMEQHWYFCYTCDLTVSKGCCSVCAKVCHRGHRVVYSRSSRFFCDCGAGGVRGSNCQCLKPRKFSGSSVPPPRGAGTFHTFLPFTEEGDQLPDSDSDVDEDVPSEADTAMFSLPRGIQSRIQLLLQELDAEGQVLKLCSSLLPSITSRRDSYPSKDREIVLGKDKVLSYGLDLLQLKKAYKSGSIDLKIKTDYSYAKELKSHLTSGSLVKSLLSISTRGRLAVGEGDKVAIFDVGQLIGQATITPVTADKSSVKPLSKNIVRFEIVHLIFNPAVENHLAVAGYEDCQVLTVSHRGEVSDRLAIELALQGSYIRRVDWVPGSQVQLMVVTNKFVKIYDLSQDNISPIHYFTLPQTIVDATLAVVGQGKMFLIVLSEHGCLYKLELSIEANVAVKPLTEMIQLQGRVVCGKGSSLYFSTTYKLLFVSYQDGTTLIGRLNSNAASLMEVSAVYDGDHDQKMQAAGLQHWRELLIGSNLFVCFSSTKSNASLVISLGEHEIFAQNLRHLVGSTSPLVGITAYKPLSKDKIQCLVLHDDGSLQIYSHIPIGMDVNANAVSDRVKKLGSGILSKAYCGSNTEFPLDFFEKTICITTDVKLSGDAIRNGDSEGAKLSLASEDGFLESPSPTGFKIIVSNPNPDIVMVGFRLHVGNTSANHIPTNISIFQREIKLDEGMRSWYDIPFTVAESLLADEEFVLSVSSTFSGSSLPRIDSLEVYGRAKDEFGWKEKMEAVLDMEARALGCGSWGRGSGKKRRIVQSAIIQERIVADGLRFLSKFYSLCRSPRISKADDAKVDLSKLKCKQLLETVFESDKEPLLQAAACSVLQSVFPKKEMYYKVKDTMRLLGVMKSTAMLSSKLGVGYATAGCIIEEFTAQMRAVSKIALQRRSNLATFLERNGSEVVDGLMQVLWEILEVEQPDTQTMNNIVISSVELIYCYAECLALHGKDSERNSIAPAVSLFKKLLFSSDESVQTSSSLAISSRLLQVPFPKQTMLSADESAENVPPVPVHTDMRTTTVGNDQIMVEEDAITSSVQYCCDGCSTVPILRRRWHCTICPDFDLCEACHELVADRLPPPHSRDHPMTAIPIEVEILGGEGTEMNFSANDLHDSGLLPPAVDKNAQTSTPSIHSLEPSESGDFSAIVTDPVMISASKRAVNSLLLSEFLQQMKGWMEAISGVQAVPIMQFFYRLSSTVGGPFVDSSKPENVDLEKLIRWFLEEINLNKPFVARERSSFGEVAILVFMFFTLMLRNWHHPGNESSVSKSNGSGDAHERGSIAYPVSTSSAASSSLDDQDKSDFALQLHQACASLKQQSFVNYLMDILQQLVHVFKSQNVNFDGGNSPNLSSGCGALLTVKRDLPAGNFSPFFSDSYAKSHRADIFADYHRLLLENTFRLVYTLVRPDKHDKSGERERPCKVSSGKDLKLDGYQDVFCSYINNPRTAFVRRYARRLFLHLCGSKTHYYSVRDSWQFSSEFKKLYKYKGKSGGFQNTLPYERSVKIVKCLSTVAEVAASRPRNWQKYCLRHTDILQFLMDGLFYFGEESVVQTLKLLSLAFYTGKDVSQSLQKFEVGDTGISSDKSGSQSLEPKKKKKGEEGSESGSEKSYLDMEQVVDIFFVKDGDILKLFIDYFLLEWNSSSVRMEARSVLYGIWHHTKYPLKETILITLLQKIKCLPMYGQNIIEYTELVTHLLEKISDNLSKQQSSEIVERCLTPDVVRFIFETLHSQNELLANHPNSAIYNTLSSLVEFDGYYLESEPCVACSTPEVPYSRMKLESLKSETKFTDNRIIVKCTGSYTIQSVSMNVHDSRRSKSVRILNLYYNNRPVADLSELKNNWSLWKRAKSCHLTFNQTELKVDFTIPITACNFMIELDSFYENLQALSLEPLQCPRCSRQVTDKHGICSNCHENAYQCRQCRNINYENLDSFLCNECGYSKYGRFEFNFMAKPSFTFDEMENDEDMKRGLSAIESESENAHRRYQQLLGFKKPLLKIVSSIGENEMEPQQDSVQQMMVSLPGPSCKISRKIALLGVLYGEKCKAAFDSVSKSVQTLQGLRRVLMSYLHQKHSGQTHISSRFIVSRSSNSCYGCASTFVAQCLEILQVLSRHPNSKKQLVSAGILSQLFENNIHQGPKTARVHARAALCAFSEGDINAVTELNCLIQKKVMYCLEHHRSMDIALATHDELLLLSEVCSLADEFWESRLRVVFQLLFSSIKLGAKHPAISEHIILPCLRIISQVCTPPKPDTANKELSLVPGNKSGKETSEKTWDGSHKTQEIQLVSYTEWEKGASYLDFVRRQYKVSQAAAKGSQRSRPQRYDYLALKYALKWKRRACKTKNDLTSFELGSWVTELVLSACSQSIRSEMCSMISLLCGQNSSRQFRLLNLLLSLLPATLSAGENAAEYFELLFKMIESEESRLFLTVRGCLGTICELLTQEVSNVESLERSLHIDISQGFILHKLIELLGKFLEVPNIRSRFMRDKLLSGVLEAFIVIRGLVVQKTKLISDSNLLLKNLLDGLTLESDGNKKQFIQACVSGLQTHGENGKERTSLFILEQLCNLISPSKPEPVYLLVLNKAHTQEEFIRGSMTKNPYSSAEIGPLMRDVKNKICHQLDMLGLVEDDYGMELLVAGSIISLDLSIAQVYEQVWRKTNQSSHNTAGTAAVSTSVATSVRECPPMTVTYRLQGLDGEATEPMIKELEEDREECQDPEVEFAIAAAVRECGGLEIILGMIQRLCDDFKSSQEQLIVVLNLLMLCCKIRENRRALLRLGALTVLLETVRHAFTVDAMELAEGILLIVESLTLEANESDNISFAPRSLTVTSGETGDGEQAKKIVLMFLDRLCHPPGLKKSNKQQRNTEMVARILPYLTYGEPAAMETLIQHFDPYLQDWREFDKLQQMDHEDSTTQHAEKQRFSVENFVRVSESLKTSSCGGRFKDIILEKGITRSAVKHLRQSFAFIDQTAFRSSVEWASALKLPSIPFVLSMLRGLSMGHLPTQKCIDDGGILPLLHALEGVPGENEIGARAENLLDVVSNKEGTGDGFLAEKVHKLRDATKDEMRRKALIKREQMLKGLGMRQEISSDGGERIVVARPVLEGLDEMEEEEGGLACMVCREGYGLRPTDLLGVYTFSKRVNLGVGTTAGSSTARVEHVYTTVSHFNIIHFQCHQEAKRADAALKTPKKEWDGAALRNNETLCNSLFPLRGPSVPVSQYVRYVDLYWDNLHALGRSDGSRLRLLTYDIVLMLARFAMGASFSTDCKGGGKESNSKFLPFMIQMARHFLDQGNPSQRSSMAKAIDTYLSSASTPSSSGTQQQQQSEETVQFSMVNSLLSESYESWLQHRLAFLQRGIYHNYMQHTHASSSSNQPKKESHELYPIVKPILIYTGLIEQLQRFFKVKKSGNVGSEEEALVDENGKLEGWEVRMKERLLNVKEMVGLSRELQSWLDDINSAADLQEAFDVMGALGDVISAAGKCEDFVFDSIGGGGGKVDT